MKLRTLRTAATAFVAALSLSACASVSRMTPEQTTAMLNAAAQAGCKGDVHITFGAAGLDGAHGDFSLNASCDPANRAVPLKDLGLVTAPTPSLSLYPMGRGPITPAGAVYSTNPPTFEPASPPADLTGSPPI